MRTGFVALLAIAAICIPGFMRIVQRTKEANRRENDAYWARQRERIAEGSAQINAMPADLPLDRLVLYLVQDWPTEVRALAFERLEKRGDLDAELLAMLADGERRRTIAIAYLAQTSNAPSEALSRGLLDASVTMAEAWLARSPALSEDEVVRLVRDCGHCIEVAYHGKDRPIDFHPAADAWRRSLGAAPQAPSVVAALDSLRVWSQFTPPPSTAPATS